jgi:hypothetical protein
VTDTRRSRPEQGGASVIPTDLPQNRSNEMNLMNEELARAQMSARLGEALDMRRGHQLAMARRLSRRAERAALQARLALARSL